MSQNYNHQRDLMNKTVAMPAPKLNFSLVD